MGINIKDIVATFLENKDITSSQVADIVNRFENDDRFTWRDLGDISNNQPRVNIVTAKDHTLVERVTNAIDACIENKSQKHQKILNKNNITAVKEYLLDQDIWKEKEEVRVEIFPLEKTKKTNFYFIDKGIGIENQKMPYTILFFNSGHKKNKDYLRGSFGQGGSTVCRYSEYTVIITTFSERTSFTIIRNNEKENKYEYIVEKINSDKKYTKQAYQEQPDKNYLPPCIENLNFKGTTVLHVSYDFYKTSFIDYYNVFEENLFNAHLPYRLHLLTKQDNVDRPMYGLKARLEKLVDKSDVEKRVAKSFDLGNNERVEMTYYYLKKNDTSSYLSNIWHSIFVTLNGQTHKRLRRAVISEANLSKLTKKLIIEMDCDPLSDRSKVDLLDSSRQNLDKGYQELLEKSLVEFLKNDEFLQNEQLRLEEEEREKEIDENTEKYREELASMIENYSQGKYKVNKPGPGGDGTAPRVLPRVHNKIIPIDLRDTPTYFKITNKQDPIQSVINGNCNIKLECDITEKSFNANDCNIEVISTTDKPINPQIANIKNGRTVASLSLIDARVGEKLKIKFAIKSKDNQISLETETRTIEIIKERKQSKKGSMSVDAPYPIPIYRDGDTKKKYLEFGWDKDEKIAYVESGNTISIYVNMSHSALEGVIAYTDDNMVESIKQDYFINIAFASFIQHADLLFKKLEADYDYAESVKDSSLSIAAQMLFRQLKKSHKR